MISSSTTMSDVPRARPRIVVGGSSSVVSTASSSTTTILARPPRHSRSQSTGRMRIMGGSLESAGNSDLIATSTTSTTVMTATTSSITASNSLYHVTTNKALLVPRTVAPAILGPHQHSNHVNVPLCAQHVCVTMNQCDTYLLSSNGDVLKSISTKIPITGVLPSPADYVISNSTGNDDKPKNNDSYNDETIKEGDEGKQQQSQVIVEEEYSSSYVTVDQFGEIVCLPSFDYSYILDSPTTSVGERKHVTILATTPATDASTNTVVTSTTITLRNKPSQAAAATTTTATLLQSIVEVPSPVDSCSSCCSNASPTPLTNHTNSKKFNFNRDSTTSTTATSSSLPMDITTRVPPATNAPTTSISSTTNSNNNQHKQQRPMIPGIPQKVSFFHDLRVTTISTHPSGNHVLFISSEGLLFAFGDNTFGQCGVGAPAIPNITEPTMVTAFLENGGKASAISAGVDYSLVVVRTNLERIEKLLRSKHQQNSTTASTIPTSTHPSASVATAMNHPPPSSVITTATTTSFASGSSTGSGSMMTHVGLHQMYAFGNNEGDKLGLINGKATLTTTNATTAPPNYCNNNHNIVPLPRRVALHSKIFSDEDYNMSPRIGKRRNGSIAYSKNAKPNAWFQSSTTTSTVSEDFPSPGIFCVEASQYHSMALVHLPDGTIELYSWGISPSLEYGALGCTKSLTEDSITSLTTTPTVVLTSRPTPFSSRSRRNDNSDFPLRIALGLHCSFITYKSGQVLSMGYSSDGLLGLGPGIISSAQPAPIVFEKSTTGTPNSSGGTVCIRQVSVGHRHAIAVSSAGQAYSWGVCANGRLGQGNNSYNSSPRGSSDLRVHGSEGEGSIVWAPKLVALDNGNNSEYSNNNARGSTKVYRAAAGPDASIFIMSDGQVLSCGKQSGQLGQGTVTSDSIKLTPMFGGLYLWKDEEEHHHIR